MPQPPLITTVIPTFRRPRLLRRAIQSVLNQTYPHFRICVYDNASGDETAAVVAAIAARDSRVSYHCQPKNIGLERNFAYGSAQVTTPFLNFLCDDDLFLPEYFASAIATFERNPRAMMFTGGTIFAATDGTTISAPFSHWPVGVYEPPGALIQWTRAPFGWASTTFARAAVANVGGVSPAAREFLDCDLMLRVASRYPVVVAQTLCAVFFYGGLSGQATTVESWYQGKVQTRAAINGDPTIEPAARAGIAMALNEFITRSSRRTAMQHAARFGRLHDAQAGAGILRKEGARPFEIKLLDLFASAHTSGRLARWGFRRIYNARRLMQRITRKSLYRRCDALIRETLIATDDRRPGEASAVLQDRTPQRIKPFDHVTTSAGSPVD